MAYCGCATKANKGRWAAVVIFLALAIIFFIANVVLSRDCRVCNDVTVNGVTRRDCTDSEFEADRDWNDVEGCSRGAVAATSLLFLITLIAATVPCCCMCCCATGPTKEHDYAMAVVEPQQGAAYGQAPHVQQPTYEHAQPVYGQEPPAYVQGQPANGQGGPGQKLSVV